MEEIHKDMRVFVLSCKFKSESTTYMFPCKFSI